MFPNPAAKRAPLFLLILLFLVTSAVAFAGDDDDEYGYLGVFLQDLKPSMAKALQLDDKAGVLVTDLVDDGPAEKAGLEDGDVILVFDGKNTETSKALTKAVRKTKPGEEVKVVVLREGKKKTFNVVVGENEGNEFVWHVGEGDDWKELKGLKELKDLKGLHKLQKLHGDGDHRISGYQFYDDEDGHIEVITKGGLHDIYMSGEALHFNEDRGFLGVVPENLNEQLGEYFGVEEGEGVLIAEIVEDSGAEKAGLKAGDVIVKIEGDEIEDTGDLHEAMSETKAEQKVKVEVLRKGDSKTFDVTLGEAPEANVLKHIEVLGDGDNTFTIRSPRMKMHLPRIEHRDGDEDVMFFHKDSDEDMEELREELKKLKKELKKIQDDLDK